MTKELREASPRRFAGKGLTAGYKGYVDFGCTIGTGDFSRDRLTVSFVNGVQFNPYLYVGMGAALNYYAGGEEIGIPIFANVRSHFIKSNISPFLDLRVGYSPLVDAKGLYLSPSLGCRFGLSKRVGLNVSVGYEVQEADVIVRYGYYGAEVESRGLGGVSMKVAVDF